MCCAKLSMFDDWLYCDASTHVYASTAAGCHVSNVTGGPTVRKLMAAKLRRVPPHNPIKRSANDSEGCCWIASPKVGRLPPRSMGIQISFASKLMFWIVRSRLHKKDKHGRASETELVGLHVSVRFWGGAMLCRCGVIGTCAHWTPSCKDDKDMEEHTVRRYRV